VKNQIYLDFSEAPPNFDAAGVNIVQAERKTKFIWIFQEAPPNYALLHYALLLCIEISFF